MSDLILPHGAQTELPARKSSERLAQDLDRAGLGDLADRARRDEFNDFFSEHGNPRQHLLLTLLAEKQIAERRARKAPRQERLKLMARASAIESFGRRVQNDFGRYRATRAEADLWAQHEDRIIALRETTGRVH